MVWKLLHDPAVSAAVVAGKKALVLAPMQFAAGLATYVVGNVTPHTLSVEDVSEFLGPRGMAVVFALIGAGWRWHRFRLSMHMGMSGCVFSMVLAFIVGEGQIPYADAITKNLSSTSVPMMNGFLMGLFGLLLVTGVQDFIAAYREGRKAGAQ